MPRVRTPQVPRASADGDGSTGGCERPVSRWAVLVVMCCGYFLVLLDVTIVNVALPSMARGLGAGVSGLQWVVDGYALALASLMLAGGTMGDLRGHKRIVLAGLTIFSLASLGCGLAHSTGALIGFRVLQGVGAALLLPGTLAVITHAFPEADRASAIGVWAGIGSSALAAGPLLGGGLVQALGWRAVFFLNVPIATIVSPVAVRLVHESTEPNGRRLDWPGVLVAAGTLAAVTFAFIQAGHAGVDAPVIAAVALAATLGMTFVAVERKRQDPMLPLSLLRQVDFSIANAVAGAMNLASLGLLFLLALYLQTVQGLSALQAGIDILPLFVPLSLLAPLAGRVTAQVGAKFPMIAGLLCAAAGVLLLTRTQPSTSYLTLLPALLLWGVGLGVLTPAVVAAAIRAVPTDHAGLASAVTNTSRQAAGAIGVAGFGALAGSAHARATFVAGFHTAALIATSIFAVAAATTFTFIRRPTGQ